jgi:hypothetical protein
MLAVDQLAARMSSILKRSVMNMGSSTSRAAAVILLLLLACFTASPASAANVATSESDSLKNAYATLSKADHDYKGHRKAAMDHIERACKLLGTPIKGDRKAGEAQGVSDEQLRAAQTILEAVRAQAAANNQKQVLTQIDDALAELKTALSIK